MPRLPRVPPEELLRLAQEVLGRLRGTPAGTLREVAEMRAPSRLTELVAPVLEPEVFERGLRAAPSTPDALESVTSPFVSRLAPSPEQKPSFIPGWKSMPQLEGAPEVPLPSEETVSGPTFDAAKAMDRVLRATVARFAPSKVLPELKGTGQSSRTIEPGDLRHQAAKYTLTDLEKNPSKTPEQLVRAVEPSLAQWIENKTALFSGEPRSIGRKRRAADKAARLLTQWGDEEAFNPALARKVQEALRGKGLLARPEEIRLDAPTLSGGTVGENLRVLAPSPEDVFFAREIEPATKVKQAIDKLYELLADEKFLTAKQKAALNLRYGLTEGGDSGLSLQQVAEHLSVGKRAVVQNIQGSLSKLRSQLEKLGLTFKESPEAAGPPYSFAYATPKRTPKGEPPLPRMGTEQVEGFRTPSLVEDVFGRRVPLARSFVEPIAEPPRGTTVAGELFARRELLPRNAPGWVRKERESELLVDQLLSTLKDPTGKPLFRREALVAPSLRRTVKVPPAQKPGEASLPPKPPLGMRSYQQQQAEFRNTRPTKLIPDPNGDVVINGQRYRRVKLQLAQVVNPLTGKLSKKVIELP